MIGTTLAHYQIIAKLGEGGMEEVYRAEDTLEPMTIFLGFSALLEADE